MDILISEEFIKDTINSTWIKSSNYKSIIEKFISHLNVNVLIGYISYHFKDREENIDNTQSNQTGYKQNDSDFISTNYSSNVFNVNSSEEEFTYNNFEYLNMNNNFSDEDNISRELYLKFKSIPNYELRKEVFNILMEFLDIEYTIIY